MKRVVSLSLNDLQDLTLSNLRLKYLSIELQLNLSFNLTAIFYDGLIDYHCVNKVIRCLTKRFSFNEIKNYFSYYCFLSFQVVLYT